MTDPAKLRLSLGGSPPTFTFSRGDVPDDAWYRIVLLFVDSIQRSGRIRHFPEWITDRYVLCHILFQQRYRSIYDILVFRSRFRRSRQHFTLVCAYQRHDSRQPGFGTTFRADQCDG